VCADDISGCLKHRSVNYVTNCVTNLQEPLNFMWFSLNDARQGRRKFYADTPKNCKPFFPLVMTNFIYRQYTRHYVDCPYLKSRIFEQLHTTLIAFETSVTLYQWTSLKILPKVNLPNVNIYNFIPCMSVTQFTPFSLQSGQLNYE
jgi:hypothetical protein